jgi:hypothetical protein
MSYQGPKPFGRRRTDKPLPEEDRRLLQMIRRDVDEDSSGMIRRYLRLAARVLETYENPELKEPSSDRRKLQAAKDQAA